MSEDHVPVTDSGEKRSWKWSSLKWGSWLSDWLREAFLFLFQSRIIEPSTWFTQRRRPFQADEMWGCIFQTDLSLSQMHLLSKSFWEESQVPLPSSSVDESLTLFPCLHSCLRWCPSFLTAAIFSSTFPKNKERRCCVKRADFWSLPSCIFLLCLPLVSSVTELKLKDQTMSSSQSLPLTLYVYSLMNGLKTDWWSVHENTLLTFKRRVVSLFLLLLPDAVVHLSLHSFH